MQCKAYFVKRVLNVTNFALQRKQSRIGKHIVSFAGKITHHLLAIYVTAIAYPCPQCTILTILHPLIFIIGRDNIVNFHLFGHKKGIVLMKLDGTHTGDNSDFLVKLQCSTHKIFPTINCNIQNTCKVR